MGTALYHRSDHDSGDDLLHLSERALHLARGIDAADMRLLELMLQPDGRSFRSLRHLLLALVIEAYELHRDLAQMPPLTAGSVGADAAVPRSR